MKGWNQHFGGYAKGVCENCGERVDKIGKKSEAGKARTQGARKYEA